MRNDLGTAGAALLEGCHVELHVTNLAAARAFYVDQLRLPVLQETAAINLLAVRAGSIRLSISGDAGHAVSGNVHIVLSTADLATTIEHLEARGVPIAGPIVEAPGFCRFIQTYDPDGNLVEIAQYLRDPLAPSSTAVDLYGAHVFSNDVRRSEGRRRGSTDLAMGCARADRACLDHCRPFSDRSGRRRGDPS